MRIGSEMNQRLRRRLTCLLPAVCVLLLLLSLLPLFRYVFTGADIYMPSGREMSLAPLTPKPGSVNINTAMNDELDALPGIGPVLAQAIIDERESNGPFYYPEDLMHVKGIGVKRLADVYDQITVGE